MRSIRLDNAVPTRFAIVGLVAATMLVMQAVLVLGGATDPVTTTLLVGASWVSSGWIVLAYLLGAWGFGCAATKVLSLPNAHMCIEFSIGLAFLLLLSISLGSIGVFGGSTGTAVAWLPVIVGIACAVPSLNHRIQATKNNEPRALSVWLQRTLVCACLLPVLIAATSPPGYLWESEMGGFDALSYHLELPKHWLAAGQITSLPNNIYSFLPSFLEGAYVHLAMLAGDVGHDSYGVDKFISGGGRSLIACQLLTAVTCIAGACATGLLVRRVATAAISENKNEESSHFSTFPSTLAMCIFLLTPWSIVVGSLAYNEAAMVLFGVVSWIVAMDRNIQPAAKSIVCALLLGASFGCKPTAAFMFAPITIFLALASTPRKDWLRCTVLVVLFGLATLIPWVARNAAVSSNPVMPFASSLLGTGHWTKEQTTRFSDAHRLDGNIFDRVSLLVSPTTAETDHSVTMSTTELHRGYSNPLWLPMPIMAFVGALVLLVSRSSRPLAACTLGWLGIQLFAWMYVTHLQSRFLVPTLPLLCVCVCTPLYIVTNTSKHTLASILGLAIVCISFFGAGRFLLLERNGHAFYLAGIGVSLWNGESLRIALAEREQSSTNTATSNAPASAWINASVPTGMTVLVVGDAATLYVRTPYFAATTWDTSILTSILYNKPGSTPDWVDELRQRNIGAVVVNISELARYRHDEWIDPAITEDAINSFVHALGPPAWVSETGHVAAFFVANQGSNTHPADIQNSNTSTPITNKGIGTR